MFFVEYNLKNLSSTLIIVKYISCSAILLPRHIRMPMPNGKFEYKLTSFSGLSHREGSNLRAFLKYFSLLVIVAFAKSTCVLIISRIKNKKKTNNLNKTKI